MSGASPRRVPPTADASAVDPPPPVPSLRALRPRGASDTDASVDSLCSSAPSYAAVSRSSAAAARRRPTNGDGSGAVADADAAQMGSVAPATLYTAEGTLAALQPDVAVFVDAAASPAACPHA